jgi:hypothetical protein
MAMVHQSAFIASLGLTAPGRHHQRVEPDDDPEDQA